MSINKFMAIDLIILASIAVFSEIAGEIFGFMGMNRTILITLSYPMILAAYVRWGKQGLWLNLAIIVTDLIMFRSMSTSLMMVRALSNLGLVVGFIYLNYLSKRSIDIKTDIYTSLLYYIIGFLGLISLQGLSQVMFQVQFSIVALLLYHLANFILGLIVIIVMRIQPNFLVDMRKYLNNFHKKDVE
ncbi:MAG: hypothetical protein RBQ95_02055 [Paracholeplasma sp.]|nr:hypothetical protein [Paracholeplasma sp.]MDY3195619.1 hypothetical protein [Paracholeplasma sp.]